MWEAKHLRVLVVEDSDDDFTIFVRQLKRAGYEVAAERVCTGDALDGVLHNGWDLIVTDWMIPGFGGLLALERIAAARLDVPAIVISGTLGEEPAVAALRAGAFDFLPKDKPARFVPAIERVLREAADRRARLSAERELRMSEERYRTSFEVAPEALLTYDLDAQQVRDANPAAVHLLGYPLDDMRAMTISELSSTIQAHGRTLAEAAVEASERAHSPDPSEPYEWWFRSNLGETIPCESRIVLLPSATQRLARMSLVDLRERRRVEELRRHAIELETQNRRIQEANRLKSEFLANMSHELRTPLNAIIGFAELLHDGAVPPDAPQHKEFLGDILASGRHLLQLINDVLDLAKVEAGKLDLRPEAVDLDKLMREVVGILRTTAAAKRLRISIEVDPSVAAATLDPSRFKQVAYNYLSNALKFTPESGSITARVVPEVGDQFRLEVIDTGIGIAPADLRELFVEFHQLEAGAAKRHQGTGLGLALTKRLVEMQGGRVGVSSSVGKGSTFFAILPRTAKLGTGVPPRSALPPAPREGARTILVIEDADADREALLDVLGAAGFNVEVATTGAEAISLAHARSYDAITLDMLLPDMTGIEVLSVFRTEARTRDTPVVVVTVVPDQNLVGGYGVHEVVQKPLDPAHLLASLARAGVSPELR